MIEFSKIEKMALVRILTDIMEADGYIHPKEVEFMDNFLRDYQLTDDELAVNRQLSPEQCKVIFQSMDEKCRQVAHDLCLQMANIDEDFDQREKIIIDKLFFAK